MTSNLESAAGRRGTVAVHEFGSTQAALDALKNDVTMVGSVIEVPAEAVIGVAVTARCVYALSDATGAFDRAENDEDRALVRRYPAYRVARAISYYDLALYPSKGDH